MEIYKLIEKIRATKPLVHHITNWVTIYDCANVCKVLGASPVMAHAKEEAADMVSLASALVLNIGTLTTDVIESMKIAAAAANSYGIPVVLDVCGAGATKFRDTKCAEILNKARINIIKGNASEIARIAGLDVKTKGVDASDVGHNMMKVARQLAIVRKCAVAVTGKNDIVTDGKKSYYIKNGHDMMSRVVGTGCMAASVIGTFAAVEKNAAFAAAAGLAAFGIAGEIAARKTKSPGFFKEHMYDALYGLNASVIKRMQKIE